MLTRAASSDIEAAAVAAGMIPLWQRALAATTAGLTSPAEVRRLFPGNR
ncbi:MAG: hypothetical protein R3B90_04175 [Planctomycetaceae bacterium]